MAFEDQFYFSRLFKKIIGISPVDYRNKKKG
ncbi:MAG: AraC family transcriptional regulator [Bacteroidales bacterium]|nr:AraC family transcriptional regulator [Bacteroidales bacterium]